MRIPKYRAYIKSIGWVLPVLHIDFIKKEIAVDLSDGTADYAYYSFDEIELMQYTHWDDGAGLEVFEDDILRMRISGNTGKGIVRWNELYKDYRVYKSKEKYSSHLSFNDLDEYEVIGNLHEHSHLLEVAE